MSGIFGIFNRNGKPVSSEIVHKMLDAMSYWDPDDQGTRINGSVALGHTMLWNTPESKLEHLPNTKDHLSITMDARLDNREELACQLELTDRPIDQITDTNFIVEAYRKWGEDCPKYLLGDFAFAIWDDKKQHFFCARDHIGIKPFYYHLTDGLFVFGNEMQCFTSHPNINISLNDKSIAHYLRGEECLHNHTFIETIHKLAPATSIIITTKSMEQNKYWLPEESTSICLGSAEAYVDRLRELLEKSVKDRLRSAYPITTHLSGGLDSSGIAAITARLLRQENKKLLAFNWIPAPKENDDPEYYEWGFSKLLAEREDIEHHYIELTEHDLAQIFQDLDITTNDTVDLWYEFLVRNAANKKNSRVIFSGWGGDELVTSNGRGYFTELFLNGKVLKVSRKLKEYLYPKKYSLKAFSRLYFQVCIWRVFPLKIRCFLRKSNCYKPMPFSCIQNKFHDVVCNIKKPGSTFPETSVRNVQLAYLKGGHIQNRIESWAVSSMKDKLEYRYPLLDKRLVEFALNIPSELFLSGNTTRHIYRKAMKNILPDIIRLNHEKDEPKRVSLFHELTMKALKTVIKQSKNTQNYYIDDDHLSLSIDKLIRNKYLDRKERAEMIDSLTRSFFVYKL